MEIEWLHFDQAKDQAKCMIMATRKEEMNHLKSHNEILKCYK
jgi:hypothetical protein